LSCKSLPIGVTRPHAFPIGSDVMTARFTDTDRWQQKWYRSLPPDAKLVYEFVFSACDIAGFYEWDEDNVRFHTLLSPKRIQRAYQELVNCFETNGTYIWIPNFIYVQHNWPLNPKVNAHLGIIKRLEERTSFSVNVDRLLDGEGLPNGYEGVNVGLFNSVSKGHSNSPSHSTSSSSSKKEEELDESELKSFNEFWDQFIAIGRNIGKIKAKKTWVVTRGGRDGKSGHPPIESAVLVQAAKHYRMSCEQNNTEPQYVQHPSTFLGANQNWADWKDAPKPSSNGSGKSQRERFGTEPPVSDYENVGRES
jgi:hypothetical protein